MADIRTQDFEAHDEVIKSADAALRDIFEMRLDGQAGATEEVPAGVAYPAGPEGEGN